MRGDLLRYLLIGIVSNSINFFIYFSAYFLGGPLFTSSLIGYLGGVIFSYHFGRIWVFGQKFPLCRASILRFVAVYSVGGLGMSSLIFFLSLYLEFEYRVSWLIGATFAFCNNFIGQKLIVFQKNNLNYDD